MDSVEMYLGEAALVGSIGLQGEEKAANLHFPVCTRKLINLSSRNVAWNKRMVILLEDRNASCRIPQMESAISS